MPGVGLGDDDDDGDDDGCGEMVGLASGVGEVGGLGSGENVGNGLMIGSGLGLLHDTKIVTTTKTESNMNKFLFLPIGYPRSFG